MVTFIKDHDLRNIKHKLLLLYLLNVTDIVFTLLLINSGFYREVNPIMNQFISYELFSILLKVILPAGLLLYISLRIRKATEHQLRLSNILINLITSIYVIINILHLIWFCLLGVSLIF
ncbi:DUF5658 family protein [Vallitalea okinawensis]|uniref:DUF5658 family protein n=1 Tax=Vallitalea okinawensis TaxID=2078660 RepID=UPI000CFACC55|nr:DUF5658 family protein [Vallitalea okinawensis]